MKMLRNLILSAVALVAACGLPAQTADRKGVTTDAAGVLVGPASLWTANATAIANAAASAFADNAIAVGKINGLQAALDARQPLDGTLTALAGVSFTTSGQVAYATGADTFSTVTTTSFGRSLWDDADATAARASLGVVIGTDVQAYDADLAAYAGAADSAARRALIGFTPNALRRSATPTLMVATDSRTPAVALYATTSHTAGIFRWRQNIRRTGNYIRLAWIGTYNNSGTETPFANPVEKAAALEMPNGVTRPVFFGGRRLALLRPGAVLISDPIYAPHVPGDVFFSREFSSRLASSSYSFAGESGLLATDQTSVYANAYSLGSIKGNNGESVTISTSTGIDPFSVAATLDGTGALAVGNQNTLGPAPIVLSSNGPDNIVSLIGVGTSIEVGGADSWAGDGYLGWQSRAAITAQVPLVCCAMASSQLNTSLVAPSGAFARGSLFSLGSVIVLGAPTNDAAAGRSFAQMQADAITFATRHRAEGQRVLVATMFPRTSSTDQWKTIANQTVAAHQAQVNLWNTWVRSNPPEFDGFVDPAASSTDAATGKWKESTLVDSGTATNNAGAYLEDTSKSWTPNQFAGYVVHNTTTGACALITSNTATLLIASLPHSIGDTFEVRQQYTPDGVHPSGYAHSLAAADVAPVFSSL